MFLKSPIRATALALLMAGTALPAWATTLHWARSSDVQTLDPHAYNHGVTNAFNHQIYETLVIRNDEGELVGSLATAWSNLADDPTIWEVSLREGVTFHDGTPLEADDVVFSIERAQSATSNMRGLVSSIASVEVVDPLTLRIHTNGVNPILFNNLINIFIMNREWAEAHDATVPQDFTSGQESYAAMNENGTGAYVLVSREPDARTVLRAYDGYWGAEDFPLDIDEVIYTPIQSAATRVSALLSGEVNFLQDVPPQDVERLQASEGIEVVTGAENRSVFFGVNVGAETLRYGTAEGNPFADVRVRQAMSMVIDRAAIQRVVMRGQSIPMGTIAPPFINGYTEEMGALPAVDIDAAQALMNEAGYGDGFSITLNCTNDGAVNDEAICRGLVSMLARIGITVNLDVQAGSVQYPAIARGETDFYMMTWGVSTFDSEYMFDNLVHSDGAWSRTNFNNPEVDAMIDSLAEEADVATRDATIAAIWDILQEETIYLPLHTQVLARAMRDGVHVGPNLNNQVFVKTITVIE